jgi:hypothetical protein
MVPSGPFESTLGAAAALPRHLAHAPSDHQQHLPQLWTRVHRFDQLVTRVARPFDDVALAVTATPRTPIPPTPSETRLDARPHDIDVVVD